MIIQLPVVSTGAQEFTVQLGDRKFTLHLKYNDRSGVYSADLYNAQTKQLITAGIPVVMGQDLLEPYNFDMGRLIVIDSENSGIDAGPADLGSRVNVYWTDE